MICVECLVAGRGPQEAIAVVNGKSLCREDAATWAAQERRTREDQRRLREARGAQ